MDSNSIWKFYQKKNKTAQVNSPAYVILSPNDTTSSQNFIDFSTVGNSISSDTNAFSKIHRLSKISSNNVTIAQTSEDKDLSFSINDGGSTVVPLKFTGSTGAITMIGNTTITGNLTITGEFENSSNGAGAVLSACVALTVAGWFPSAVAAAAARD